MIVSQKVINLKLLFCSLSICNLNESKLRLLNMSVARAPTTLSAVVYQFGDFAQPQAIYVFVFDLRQRRKICPVNSVHAGQGPPFILLSSGLSLGSDKQNGISNKSFSLAAPKWRERKKKGSSSSNSSRSSIRRRRLEKNHVNGKAVTKCPKSYWSIQIQKIRYQKYMIIHDIRNASFLSF